MTSERRRHELYQELREVLSDESTDELMSALPPVGWADVATKSDVAMIRHELDALRAELRGEFQHEFGNLRAEMIKGYQSLQRWTISTMIALTAIVFAAVRLGV